MSEKFVGDQWLSRAANRMQQAAADMQRAADRIEYTLNQFGER